ncbi:MAG: putative PurR-regulated permease PerM [Planctomycetota bacterium]|jgi:predicted PurR-regulated permease PerM
MARSKPEIADLTSDEIEEEIEAHRLQSWRLFDRFKITLQKMMIWGIFFLLLFLLHDFFTLIFLTFVISFVTSSLTKVLGRRAPKLSWRQRVIIVFLAFIMTLTVVIHLAIPQVKQGLTQLNEQVQDLPTRWEEDIDPWLFEKSGFYERLVTVEFPKELAEPNAEEDPGSPEVAPALEANDEKTAKRISLWKNEQIREWVDKNRDKVLKGIPTFITDAVTAIAAVFSLLFLSMLFSFLIVLDLDTLTKEVKKLEGTKLSEFYQQTVGSIVRFGAVLGKVLEAQAVIAMVNSILTAIGLSLLGMPNIWFLSLAVFVCGFIPVAGVFISSVPICLVGLYVGGIDKMLILVAFITGIHFLEAYVLNPRIMGAALRINPILVLVILVIGHHALGVWGLLLGLPICYYFFSHVIKREHSEIGLRAKFRKRVIVGSGHAKK